MTLSVLSVGYPLAAAGLQAVGGSEQILAQIDRGLVEAGYHSHVIAPAGSIIHGTLHALPALADQITPAVRTRQQEACLAILNDVLARYPIDLIHWHGLDFADYPVSTSIPSVSTLHLPPDWYPEHVFQAQHGPWLLPVSDSQAQQCPPCSRLLNPLANGVPDEFFDAPLSRRDGGVLMLARICPEKGVHLALEAAHQAGCDLTIAGQVYPYPDHEDYFVNQIAPLLDERRQFIGPVHLDQKLELLHHSRCVLVPSLVQETSSLVVREAAAMGCPSIAFPQGHLAKSVVPGVTGFLVENLSAMVEAIDDVDLINPHLCRSYAREHFSGHVMVEAYLSLYHRMVNRAARTAIR